MNYNKKPVDKAEIAALCERYSMSPLLASIFARRGITKGNEIFYYMEDDIRFEHSPFLFNQMEDAVDRILAAREEGEKVLVFGDRDVDGISSTAILYDQLKKMGIDVSWRLPLADDAYGLSLEAVDDFAKENGTLIITVDCGISNAVEVNHAAELGIDVIVTDHHNPPDVIPDAAIAIIDPKCEDSGYPFDGISGAAVAYKLVSALRFSASDFYNSEICILDVQPLLADCAENVGIGGNKPIPMGMSKNAPISPETASGHIPDSRQRWNENHGNCRYEITCTKIRNLTKRKELKETIVPGQTSISEMKFPYFLQGQCIYVWDNKKTCRVLADLFGSGIDFNFLDLKAEVSKIWPSFAKKDSVDLLGVSKSAKYSDSPVTVSDSLFNLFVTYVKAISQRKNESLEAEKQRNLQLVGIAAIADVMMLKNENRLFVKNAIKSLTSSGPMPGLAELFAKLGIDFHNVTVKDLAWTVIPALNAAGRMGQSDLSCRLLVTENVSERNALAEKIIELNEERKKLVNDATMKTAGQVEDSIKKFGGKLCVIVDAQIHKGVTGILANRIMGNVDVPTMCITEVDGGYTGSMRSCRGVVATDFLKSFGDFFIAFGGHDAAAGFTFEKSRIDEFLKKTGELSCSLNLTETVGAIDIDAELPPKYMTPEILDVIDTFEPYGHGNEELIFLSKNLPICDAMVVGKKEPLHLKLVFDCGKYKFPCMYWNAAEKLNSEFRVGDTATVLFTVNKNTFNGNTTPQMIVRQLVVDR